MLQALCLAVHPQQTSPSQHDRPDTATGKQLTRKLTGVAASVGAQSAASAGLAETLAAQLAALQAEAAAAREEARAAAAAAAANAERAAAELAAVWSGAGEAAAAATAEARALQDEAATAQVSKNYTLCPDLGSRLGGRRGGPLDPETRFLGRKCRYVTECNRRLCCALMLLTPSYCAV